MKSSKAQLEEFFENSFIWHDIVAELESWIVQNHELLEDPSGDMTLEEFKSHSAICKALRRVINIWDYMSEEYRKENRDG